MKPSLKHISAGLAVLVAAVSVHAQDALTLRYRMKKGDKLVYRKTYSLKQTQTVMKIPTALVATVRKLIAQHQPQTSRK